MIAGDELVALSDGLLQVGSAPAHLVFKGFVLTQQPQGTRQILPVILRRQDLLLLPDPTLLRTTGTITSLLLPPSQIDDGDIFQNNVRNIFWNVLHTPKYILLLLLLLLIITSSAISQKNFQRRRDSSRRARRSAAS